MTAPPSTPGRGAVTLLLDGLCGMAALTGVVLPPPDGADSPPGPHAEAPTRVGSTGTSRRRSSVVGPTPHRVHVTAHDASTRSHGRADVACAHDDGARRSFEERQA